MLSVTVTILYKETNQGRFRFERRKMKASIISISRNKKKKEKIKGTDLSYETANKKQCLHLISMEQIEKKKWKRKSAWRPPPPHFGPLVAAPLPDGGCGFAWRHKSGELPEFTPSRHCRRWATEQGR
jgi:hypothetical protein